MKKPNVKLAAAVGASLPDLSDKNTEYWLSHPEQLAQALKSALTSLPQPTFPSFTVDVDYDQTVIGLFEATGKGKKPVEVFILDLHEGAGYISSEDAITKMTRDGFRPANAQETDALKQKKAELPKGKAIVGLGSTRRSPGGRLSVPCLDRDDSDWYLYLTWFGDVWVSRWLFAAVLRK